MKHRLQTSLFGNVRYLLAVWALCISIGGTAAPACAETDAGGVLKRDERWTADKGPYVITQDLLVPRSVHLSIEPGTKILIARPSAQDRAIPQIDALDSSMVAIVVEGTLSCVGRNNRHISFLPQSGSEQGFYWYGIVFKRSSAQFTELAFTDVAGAYNAVSVLDCSPAIHHCQFTFNNIGLVCSQGGDARVYNCVFVSNAAAGIKISGSNPVMENNIIAFNRNNGVWCDGVSKMTFSYNCVFGNADGNFLECDPELGVLKKKNDNKDSVDYKNNMYKNPVFAGSQYDSLAVERDVSLPTDKSRIRDTALAKVLHAQLPDSLAAKKKALRYPPYSLSRYSPCVNAGDPSSDFKDDDGSRNDIGMYGGFKFSPKAK
jgi:hypothetical protein